MANGNYMNIQIWLKDASRQLSDAGIATARLDCLVILEDELRKDRAWLLAHPQHELQRSEVEKLNTIIAQRAEHIPLAYLRGKAEFYGREFCVNEHTLVPRPETETMIELVKTLDLPVGGRVLDVGTGSGCIAITTALELPQSVVSGCDIDDDCLEVARQNAAALNANVNFYKDDLLEHAVICDVILANLPYVPNRFNINIAATHEPDHAIFGGSDGLDLFRRMFSQIAVREHKPQHILTESLPQSHDTLSGIAKDAGYQLIATDDFIQHFSFD